MITGFTGSKKRAESSERLQRACALLCWCSAFSSLEWCQWCRYSFLHLTYGKIKTGTGQQHALGLPEPGRSIGGFIPADWLLISIWASLQSFVSQLPPYLPFEIRVCVSAQSCLTLCNLMNCSPSGSSVNGISQTRILEWVTISFSKGSSWSRDGTLLRLLYWQMDFFSFIFISWRLITLQYCSVFCHTLTWISHGFPCVPHPEPPPASLPIPSLWVFPMHKPWALVSCIQPRLAIYFTLDNIHVSMLFS